MNYTKNIALIACALLLGACGSDSDAKDAGISTDASGGGDAAVAPDAGGTVDAGTDAGFDGGLPDVTVPDPTTIGGALTNPASTYGSAPFFTPAKDLDLTEVPDYSRASRCTRCPGSRSPAPSW